MKDGIPHKEDTYAAIKNEAVNSFNEKEKAYSKWKRQRTKNVGYNTDFVKNIFCQKIHSYK